MPDEISVDDVTTVLFATMRGNALAVAGPSIALALDKAIVAFHQIEAALAYANVTHVDGEFSADDRAVVDAAENYVEAETAFMQKLLEYVESTQAGLLGLAGSGGTGPVGWTPGDSPGFKGLLPG